MKQKYLILFSLAGLIVCLDQLTKLLVKTHIAEQLTWQWWGGLYITHHRNQGFAFTLIQKLPLALQNLFFIAIPIFALFLIVMIFIKLQDNQMITSLALTTILGGAIGNMIDRLDYGPVLDIVKLDLGFWRSPPFNFADLAIVSGVGIVFVQTLLSHRREKIS